MLILFHGDGSYPSRSMICARPVSLIALLRFNYREGTAYDTSHAGDCTTHEEPRSLICRCMQQSCLQKTCYFPICRHHAGAVTAAFGQRAHLRVHLQLLDALAQQRLVSRGQLDKVRRVERQPLPIPVGACQAECQYVKKEGA